VTERPEKSRVVRNYLGDFVSFLRKQESRDLDPRFRGGDRINLDPRFRGGDNRILPTRQTRDVIVEGR